MPLSAGGVERMKTTMYDTKSLKKPLMSLFRHWLEIEFTKKSNNYYLWSCLQTT